MFFYDLGTKHLCPIVPSELCICKNKCITDYSTVQKIAHALTDSVFFSNMIHTTVIYHGQKCNCLHVKYKVFGAVSMYESNLKEQCFWKYIILTTCFTCWMWPMFYAGHLLYKKIKQSTDSTDRRGCELWEIYCNLRWGTSI